MHNLMRDNITIEGLVVFAIRAKIRRQRIPGIRARRQQIQFASLRLAESSLAGRNGSKV